MPDLLVVGGGITGLSTAYIAAREGQSVTVLEASDDFGGLLRTFPVGGNQLEHFYHHFFTHDAEIHWLINELGLADELVFRTTSMGIFRNGTIHPFNNATDLLKFSPIPFLDRLRFGISSVFLARSNWRKLEHISALDWLTRKAGKAATNAIWKPLLNIKFGKHDAEVPAAWMAGRLKQRMQSRKAGDERLGYLNGSLQTLLNALLARLKELGVELVANAPVTAINAHDGSVTGVETPNGTFSASKVVLTIPSPIIARLLGPHLPYLSAHLSLMKSFGAVCTVLELTKPLSDVYWLNIADDDFPFGGVIEHTNFIGAENYEGKHIAYLSRYFTLDEPLASLSNDELLSTMLEALPRVYPDFDPKSIQKAHVFKSNSAAPVCTLNFGRDVEAAGGATDLKGLYIANMMHVYPDERSTNNSIRVAAEICRVMGINSDFVPRGQSLAGQIGL